MGRPKAASSVKIRPATPKAPEVRRYSQIGVHALPEVVEALSAIAEDRQTNVSQLCRMILTDYVRDHGRKPAL
jgi:hypothetical protein